MPLARLVDEDGNDIKVDGKYLVVKISDGTEIADIETTSTKTDNLDEKTCLVTNAILHARYSDSAVYPVRVLSLSADAQGTSVYAMLTSSYNMFFNETNWDRARSKTSDGSDINNSTVGCQIVINLNYVWDSVNEKWVPMTQP
ncbi:MAG: hypothetical protein ACTSR2_04935 [Candidatus Hodarchaeales archaeon]